VGCMITLLGVIVPRLAILAGWLNDPVAWGSAFNSQIWPILGFLFLPWTTFFFVLFQSGGYDAIEMIFLICAILGDIGTWGGGIFGNKDRVSSYYRGT